MRVEADPRKTSLSILLVAIMTLAPLAGLTIMTDDVAASPLDGGAADLGDDPMTAPASHDGDPFWGKMDAFTTKTGYRMVFLWEAAEPIAGVVQWGYAPDALDNLAVPVGHRVDQAQMAYMDIGRNQVVTGKEVYWRVLDQVSGSLSPVHSFELGNAWKSDASDGIYEINAILQLDSKSLPDALPWDQGLTNLAQGIDILAERIWDATDGHVRIGKVIVTDTAAQYPLYQPSGPGVCANSQTVEGHTLQHTMADFVVQTTIPFDSHTWGGGTPVIDHPCTAFYIGRIGQLVVPWVDDAHLGYTMAHEFAHYALGAPDLYNTQMFTDPRGCANRDPNSPGYDVSLMHNSGGWTGARWDLTELDREMSDCDRSVGTPQVTWDQMIRWYPGIPDTTTSDIDRSDSDPNLKRGNPDGDKLDVYILNQAGGLSTLQHYIQAPGDAPEENPLLHIQSPADGSQVPPTAIDVEGVADRFAGDNLAPDATLSASPESGDAPLDVAFTLGADDADGSIASWAFDYGDGSTTESGTGSAPPSSFNHTYTADGVYEAVLSVEDDKGAVGAAMAVITVGGGAAMRIGTDNEGDAPASGACPGSSVSCDHGWTAAATPGMDLVSAHIEDTGDDIRFSWKVSDSSAFWNEPSGDPGAGDPSHVLSYMFETTFSTSPATNYAVSLRRAVGDGAIDAWLGSRYAVLTSSSLAGIAGVDNATNTLWVDMPKSEFPEFAAFTTLNAIAVQSAFNQEGAQVQLTQTKDTLDTVESDAYTLEGSFDPLGTSARFAVARPAPSAVPSDPHIQDATGDSFIGGDQFTHQDIEAAWFEHDDDHVYIGMKVVDIPADATTTTSYAYHVNFKPDWTSAGWAPATAATFTGLRVHASIVVTNAETEHRFELHTMYNDPTAGPSYATLADLAGSEIDPNTDIIWWVIPRLALQSPPDEATMSALSADTTIVYRQNAGVTEPGLTWGNPGIWSDEAGAVVPTYTLSSSAEPLIAEPGGPYSGAPGASIVLSGDATGGATPYACQWSTADDGTFSDASSCSTTVSFATIGDKTVTLNVTDSNGATDEASVPVFVNSVTGERIEFRVGGSLVGTLPLDTSTTGAADWSKTIDLTGYSGPQTLTATWVDADNTQLDTDSVNIVVENVAAAFVTITQPTAGSTVSGVIDVGGQAGHGTPDTQAPTAFDIQGPFAMTSTAVRSGEIVMQCVGCQPTGGVPGTIYSSASWVNPDLSGVDGIWFDISGFVGAEYRLEPGIDSAMDVYFFNDQFDEEGQEKGKNVGPDIVKTGTIPAGSNWAFIYMRRTTETSLGALDEAILTMTPPLSAPRGLTGSAAWDTTTISWEAPQWDGNSAIENYSVYRDGVHLVKTTATTFNDTGLTPGDQYNYSVSAWNADGEGPQSAPLALVAGNDLTPPMPVASLSFTTVGTSTVTLEWPASSDPETGISHYVVRRDGSTIGTTTDTSFTDGGLAEGTTYTYAVVPVNGQGAAGSGASDEVTTGTTPIFEKVSLYVGATLIGNASIDSSGGPADWSIPWDTRDVADGVYTLKAVYDDGRDGSDLAEIDVEVSNIVPEPFVRVSTPAANSTKEPPIRFEGAYSTTGEEPSGNGAAGEAMHPQLSSWLADPWVQATLGSDAYRLLTGTLAGLDGYIGAFPSAQSGSPAIVVLLEGAVPRDAPSEGLGVPIRYLEDQVPQTLATKTSNKYDVLSLDEFEAWRAAYTGPAAPEVQQGLGPGSAIKMRNIDEFGVLSTFICSTSYLYEDPNTGQYYLSTAGHCLLDHEVTNGQTNPDSRSRWVDVCVADCVSNTANIGSTYVRLQPNATYHPVHFAYQDGIGKDFGLIEIPETLHTHLRPWMSMWGGPTQFERPATGDPLVHYGHGLGIGSATPTQGRMGITLDATYSGGIVGAGWIMGGDSGSSVGTAFPRTDEMLFGDGASGALTHSVVHIGLPLFFGTDLERGLQMAGMGHLRLITEDEDVRAPGAGGPDPHSPVTIQDPAEDAALDKDDGAVTITGVADVNATSATGTGTWKTYYLHREDCTDNLWMDATRLGTATNCGSRAVTILPAYKVLTDNVDEDLPDLALANVYPADPIPAATIPIDTTRPIKAVIHANAEGGVPNALVNYTARLSYGGTVVAEKTETRLIHAVQAFDVHMMPRVDEIPAFADLQFALTVNHAAQGIFIYADGDRGSNIQIPLAETPEFAVQVAIDDPTFASSNQLAVTGDAAWSATWDVTSYGDGAHTIYARALVDGVPEGVTAARTVTLTNDTQPPTGPTASFSTTVSDLSVDFTDTSSPGDAIITTWSWDFGDGDTSSAQHPAHTYGADGTYTVTLTVTDANGLSDSTSESVSVADGVVELPVEMRLVGPDAQEVLPWTEVARPVEGEAGFWDLLWDPSDPPEGDYVVEVRMLADGVPVATTSTPFVVNINVAPILDPIAPQSVEENSPLSFGVTATDGDNDTLVLTASGVPIGATFTDNGDGTGQFDWTPGTGDRGTYTVTVNASDGQEQDSTAVTITVFEEELPPVLDPIADQTLAEGDTLDLTITGSDINGDALSLTVTGMPGAASLQRTGAGTWRLAWTPGFSQHGVYPMTATLSDGMSSVSDTFNVTVTDVDVAPVFTNLRDQVVLVNTDSMSYVDAQDFDGDAVALSASGMPSWVTFEDLGSGRGRFAYEAPPAVSGQSWSISVTASTGTLSTTNSFTLQAIGFMQLEITPGAGGVYEASPGVGKTLKATVRNAGNAGGNVSFEAITARGDWVASEPGDLWLDPGQSKQVTFVVTPGQAGSSSAVTLKATATDYANTKGTGNFVVRIPVLLTPGFDQTSAAFGTDGLVTARFLDGSPAAGVAITVVDTHQLGSPFVNSATGDTDENGTFWFRFDTNSPGGNLPGEHSLDVTGLRDGRMDRASAGYTVLV